MRRVEQQRLEAALCQLHPDAAQTSVGAPSADELLSELESAAAETEERVGRDEQSASRLHGALDALAVGVVVGDEHGEEIFRNLAALRLGAERAGEVVADQAVAEVLATASQGEEVELTLELSRSPRRELLIRANPIGEPESAIGAVAILEDVSERRRVDAIRRDFVANVSHELKTPVGALSLLAETLDGEEDTDIVARLASPVATEAERLSRIIDDLLDLSRIEANEGRRLTEVDLSEIVAVAAEAVVPSAAAKSIMIEVGPRPKRLMKVLGDRLDLVSAVSNLMDNAVKYSEDGSTVTVELQADSGVARIAVSDRGIGIPEKELERIFERFYRVDRARSRLTGGTGLGLSIVRHVAANHGGTVEVTSGEGEGSTFTLVVPVGVDVGTEVPSLLENRHG